MSTKGVGQNSNRFFATAMIDAAAVTRLLCRRLTGKKGAMAEIICIIGTKGGTGKTTLSHMLCHGLNLLGRGAACVMTDAYREPVRPHGRRYVIADARSADARTKVVDKLRSLPGWMGVLDGGANRTDTDIALYALSDLVLLPFRDSAEDVRTVLHDMELFPRAFALPSQWPTNPWQLEAASKLLAGMPQGQRHRILSPSFAISASKLMLQTQLPEVLPTPLNNAARALAAQVIDLLAMGAVPRARTRIEETSHTARPSLQRAQTHH